MKAIKNKYGKRRWKDTPLSYHQRLRNGLILVMGAGIMASLHAKAKVIASSNGDPVARQEAINETLDKIHAIRDQLEKNHGADIRILTGD